VLSVGTAKPETAQLSNLIEQEKTFLAAVCREWEGAADLVHGVRTVKLRTGLVLDPTGGALGRMLPLFRFGLGGKLGSGKQWWSWITLHDQIRAIVFALESKIEGPINLTSPNPCNKSGIYSWIS